MAQWRPAQYAGFSMYHFFWHFRFPRKSSAACPGFRLHTRSLMIGELVNRARRSLRPLGWRAQDIRRRLPDREINKCDAINGKKISSRTRSCRFCIMLLYHIVAPTSGRTTSQIQPVARFEFPVDGCAFPCYLSSAVLQYRLREWQNFFTGIDCCRSSPVLHRRFSFSAGNGCVGAD